MRVNKAKLGFQTLESRDVMSISFVGGLLSVAGTAGIDQIELFGRGGSNIDVIEFSGAPVRSFTGVTSIVVDGGAEGDGIKVEDVSLPTTIVGGAGGDKIQYVASAAGGTNVNIQGGSGMDEIQVDVKTPANSSTTPVRVNVAIDSGADDDKIQVQIVSESAVLATSTTINDASGNEDVVYQLDQKSQLGGSSVTAAFRANLAGGNDNVLAKVESESQTSNFQMAVNGNAGMKGVSAEVMFEGAAAHATVGYAINTGGDMDKIGLKTISQARTSLTHNATINTGGGNDVALIGIEQIGAARAAVTTNVDLGAGNDEFEFGFSGDFADVVLHGTVTGGLGDDKVLAMVKARSMVNNMVLLGGGGTDFVDFLV
jgi:hypothetical protein